MDAIDSAPVSEPVSNGQRPAVPTAPSGPAQAGSRAALASQAPALIPSASLSKLTRAAGRASEDDAPAPPRAKASVLCRAGLLVPVTQATGAAGQDAQIAQQGPVSGSRMASRGPRRASLPAQFSTAAGGAQNAVSDAAMQRRSLDRPSQAWTPAEAASSSSHAAPGASSSRTFGSTPLQEGPVPGRGGSYAPRNSVAFGRALSRTGRCASRCRVLRTFALFSPCAPLLLACSEATECYCSRNPAPPPTPCSGVLDGGQPDGMASFIRSDHSRRPSVDVHASGGDGFPIDPAEFLSQALASDDEGTRAAFGGGRRMSGSRQLAGAGAGAGAVEALHRLTWAHGDPGGPGTDGGSATSPQPRLSHIIQVRSAEMPPQEAV